MTRPAETSRRPFGRRPEGPARPDTGGVWITTGVVLGVLAYAAAVLMLIAGDTAVLPLVVVPLVLVVLIGLGNLLGGRTSARGPVRHGPEGALPPEGEGAGPSGVADGPVGPVGGR